MIIHNNDDYFGSHQRLSEERLRAITRFRMRRGRNTNSEEEAHKKGVQRLPAVACDFYDDVEPFVWGPTLREVLVGTRDKDSPLQHLRGHEETLVRHIYTFVTSKWSTNVTLTIPAHFVGCAQRVNGHVRILRFNKGRAYGKCTQRELIRKNDLLLLSSSRSPPSKSPPAIAGLSPPKREQLSTTDSLLFQHRRKPQELIAYSPCGKVSFPFPADRHVNMMPFIFGRKASLPEDLQCYFDMIEECPYSKKEIGKVGYLTIYEAYIKANTAQRRDGIRIEAPSIMSADNDDETSNNNTALFTPAVEQISGEGALMGPDQFKGGIYMASNMENTSMVWDALVDKHAKGIVDCHGGCEHLRPLFGPGYTLRANELIWMTDCTPHQTLVPKESGYHQFFRVVTSPIYHWYSKYSTRNPLVPLPSNVIEVPSDKCLNRKGGGEWL